MQRGIPQLCPFVKGVKVLRILLTIQLVYMGCSGAGKNADTGIPNALNDQDAGAPATDADGTDVDEGANADADVGPPEYADWALVGRVEYTSTDNEITACDSTIRLDGTAFVGECEGCDYAFLIEPTIEDDRGNPDTCDLNPLLSFVSDGVREDLILAHADEMYIEQDEVDVLITNSVQVGFSMYYEATETSEAVRIDGPIWWQMYHDEIEKDSTFSREGNALNWTFAFENTVATWDDFAMLDDCGEELTDEATEGFIGGTTQTNTVPCDGWQADVWEVILTDGDEGFQVLVDTQNPDTTFDPAILVNDPDGCVSLYADDGFDCTHPPPHYKCPAGVVNGEPGTYQIMVFSYGQCTTGDVDYQISVSGGSVGDSLVLAMDNVDRFENLEFTNKRIEISGCATLFPEGAPSNEEACEPAAVTLPEGDSGEDVGDSGETETDTGALEEVEEDTAAPDTTGSDSDAGADDSPDGGTGSTTTSDDSTSEVGESSTDGGEAESDAPDDESDGEGGETEDTDDGGEETPTEATAGESESTEPPGP